jgi:dihydroneopterin aldolase
MGQHSISVLGIKTYSYHGCLDQEALIGQEFEVNVHFLLDFEEAAETDDLTKTVDYVKVYQVVKQEMAVRAKLIETVAKRIHDHLRRIFPWVFKIDIELIKFNPPVNGPLHSAIVRYSA